MKILLQHRKTRFYFQQPSGWIQEIEAASDFLNSQDALEFINSHEMPDVQIVVAFLKGDCIESFAFQIEPPGKSFDRPEV